MANNPFFSDLAAKTAVDAMVALLNGGTLEIYDGSQPADANTAITTQNLLGTLTFNATAFAASVASGTAPNRAAVATANSISDVAASATGTAAWFRAKRSAGNGSSVVMDGTVGTSGADLIMTDTSLTSGETMHVASLTVSNPE
jgi:hypothetical protein